MFLRTNPSISSDDMLDFSSDGCGSRIELLTKDKISTM